MCSVCFCRQSLDESDFNRRKAAQRVLQWQGAEQRSFAYVALLLRRVVMSCEGRMANTEQVRRLGFRRSVFDLLKDAELARANDLLDGRLK